MSLTITTQIEINATPNPIWGALLDFESYPSWNSFITKISGTPQLHAKLSATIGNMKFKPTVLECIPNKKFTWLGSLFFKGVFDGKHSFEISALSPTSCLFIQKEDFNGFLVPLFKKKLNTETKEGFRSMNREIKGLVEGNNA